MSKHRRTLVRIASKPTPAGIKWDELTPALKSLGFSLLKGKGSRRKFYHPGLDVLIICHQPHPQPDLCKGVIAYIAEILEENGLI